MAFSVRFTREGKESLHRIHIENQKEVKKVLKELSSDLDLGKPLIGRLEGFSNLRVGNYRVIYVFNGEVIMVHYVGHRKDVFRDFVG